MLKMANSDMSTIPFMKLDYLIATTLLTHKVLLIKSIWVFTSIHTYLYISVNK